MARNSLAGTDWTLMGPRVLAWLREYVPVHGVRGATVACARAFASEGVRSGPLYNYLQRQALTEWDAIRAGRPFESAPVAPPPPVVVPAAPEPAADPVEVERDRLERLAARREEREALRAIAGERSLRAFLERLARETTAQLPPPPPYQPPAITTGTATETLLLMLSDWHAFETVKAERMRGFNAYDGPTFGRRVRKVVDTTLSLKRRMERGGGWRFPRLVVSANGDFVSGTIHELERHTDAPNIVWAVYATARVLAACLRDLAGDFEQVEVFCSSGNHGRLPDARRMQQKDPTRNWDSLVYLIARDALADCPQVRWYIPDAYSVAFDVEGWRFLQTHGHDIKSWNQIPHYGINRAVANLNALEAAHGRPVNYFLFAHFHNKTSLEHAAGEWFINGSLIGGTEFSMQALGKVDRPCQWLLGVHADHGVTHRWPLVLRVDPASPGYEVEPWRHARLSVGQGLHDGLAPSAETDR